MTGERDIPTEPHQAAEDVDLPAGLRAEILALEGRLDRITHYEALGLRWGAGADEARSAYIELVKRFHPDRYGGRRLGPYRARLDRIVRRLTDARDTLADDGRRREYEARTAPPTELARREAQRIEDELRAGERRARLGRTNPLLARAARVAGLVNRGKTLLAAGDHAQAVNDFLTAAALDPRHPEAKALAEEARRRGGSERARELCEEAQRFEAAGRPEAALDRYRLAVEQAPHEVRPAIAAARAALRLGLAAESRDHALAATRAAPRDARAFTALGAALAELGERAEAKSALEHAVELGGDVDEAKGLLKKLRWRLFR